MVIVIVLLSAHLLYIVGPPTLATTTSLTVMLYSWALDIHNFGSIDPAQEDGNTHCNSKGSPRSNRITMWPCLSCHG